MDKREFNRQEALKHLRENHRHFRLNFESYLTVIRMGTAVVFYRVNLDSFLDEHLHRGWWPCEEGDKSWAVYKTVSTVTSRK